MQRLTGEDGAVAVLVAVTLVVMLGLSALVLDVGNLYWERRQLQNGADAAALAAAQDIVDGSGATALATARQYADSNNSRGAYIDGTDFVVGPNSVTVTTQTGSAAGPGELTSIFAGVLGVDAYETSATATASWGSIGGAATIPLTFSYCEWEQLVGDVDNPSLPTGLRTLMFHTPGGADCKGPAGHYAPGGWGWLRTDGDCRAEIVQGEVPGNNGLGNPSARLGCAPADFQNLIGQTVLMPIFERVTGSGANTVYDILGFAAVEIEGYRLHPGQPNYSYNAPCSNPNTCIRARFVRYYDLGSQPATGGTDLGAYVIGLTG